MGVLFLRAQDLNAICERTFVDKVLNHVAIYCWFLKFRNGQTSVEDGKGVYLSTLRNDAEIIYV